MAKRDPALDTRFRELFAKRPELEYSEIAYQLNKEFKLVLTRSAVSGMAKRSGLSRQGSPNWGRHSRLTSAYSMHRHVPRKTGGGNGISDRVARAQATEQRMQAKAALQAERVALGEEADSNPFNGIGVQGLVELLDLGGTNCRWPYDSPDHIVRYCPNRKADSPSVPYCGTHTNKARGTARPSTRALFRSW